MNNTDGLLSAYILDGRGVGREVDWEDIHAWSPDQGPIWIHLDRRHEQVRQWMYERSGLDEVICDALLTEDTRPRCTVMNGGTLVILRGVNLNPGAEPDDMISLRVWIEDNRLISLRFPRLMAIADVRDELAKGSGPATISELLVALAEKLTRRMSSVLDNLDEMIDRLELDVMQVQSRAFRQELLAMRRQVITLHRYIHPQREALAHLLTGRDRKLSEEDDVRLREVMDDTTRYIEDLSALRDRAAIIQEQMTSRQAEKMNRTMYVLSLVATIFLPLGLLTGLLGINVGGIPGTDYHYAFLFVCLGLVVLAGLEMIILIKFRWF